MSIIVCPSGMSLEIRELKGKELKILQDKNAKRSARIYDNILTACTVALVSNGPAYTFEDQPVWDKVLVGDKLYALLAIRAETFGEDYDFKFQCGSCEERGSWFVKLPDGLPIKKLAAEDAAAFAAGTPLETTLADGKLVKYRLVTGADERALALSKESESPIAVLARRIVSIEGVALPEKYLEDVGLSDIKTIAKSFESHDCGVETDIEVQCQKCRAIQDVTLPLDRRFWMPIK